MSLQICGLNVSSSQKELQPHGTIDFPCAAYESAHSDNASDIIPWHWHEELEIVYIKEGTLKLQIPAKDYILNAGDLVILNANLLHSAIGAPYGELCSLVFSPFLLTGNSSSVFYVKYLQPLFACPCFALLQINGDTYVDLFQTAFHALKYDTFAYEFIVRENLSKLMLVCFQELQSQFHTAGNVGNLDSIRLTKMLDFIQNHYAESLTLSMIASSADLGERECLRCFKRTIGDSPVQYLLKYRLMQSAKRLLEQPSADISEIALACGFDYPSYYSKQFKRYYKCTPKAYRKQPH